VRPVTGHGCVSWNSRLTEADRYWFGRSGVSQDEADGEHGGKCVSNERSNGSRWQKLSSPQKNW
jgi:hypothetical protein